MDKFGMDPHDAKGFDSGSTFGKGGEMQKGDSKKDIPAPPPCYTVQASPFPPVARVLAALLRPPEHPAMTSLKVWLMQ